MSRAALAFEPTYETVVANRDAYVSSLTLRRLAKQSGRYWSFHSVPTTVALPNNCYAKSLAPFSAHDTEPTFRELLREYAEYECPRPSGYADVFHERFKSPRVDWSVNATLAPVFAGGWQDAISVGAFRSRYYKYDMRSAYLWAATLGMPNVRTYTRSTQPWKQSQGVYRLKLQEPCKTAPFPFNRAVNVLASVEEIETYGLRIEQVLAGCCWKDTIDGNDIIDALRVVSTWKHAGRAYWGRWAQLVQVQCVANGKKWFLPNLALNIPWAHMIVARVKMRLWEFSTDAVHVYVDSVITPHVLPTGHALGDWKLERIYERGVIVRGPGQYGDIDAERLERMAGVPTNSPRRTTATLVQ